ncbi:fructoselysine 6-kinase [Robertmurraya korlensis]|uniref:fructoselysine 6-kinase n=1 Tax=Robertmurraya korlensis TaxID=519977 RepID=UPI000825B14A|nr:fructoselysine 6-kinase [Robertmurraya korlensis]
MKVIGFGDNVVDKYVDIQTMYPGGNTLNFTVYAKQLGCDSAFMGIFGTDLAAAHNQDTLKKMGVDTSHCKVVEGENGYATVDLVDGDRVFLRSNNGGISNTSKFKLTPEDLEYIKTFQLLHSSKYSYIENELTNIQSTGVPISFDFSDDFTEEYIEQVAPLVDYSFLSCSHLDETEVRELLKKVHSLGSQIIVGTLGSKGALLYNGTSFYSQVPKLVEAVDTLGAGDSFITAFLLNYVSRSASSEEEDRIQESLRKAAEFAAKTCMVEGAFGYGLKYEE